MRHQRFEKSPSPRSFGRGPVEGRPGNLNPEARRPDLRARLGAAPLKAEAALLWPLRSWHLRARLGAAPLKDEREARHELPRVHLRARLGAAPLKVVPNVVGNRGSPLSPRSFGRGPVEGRSPFRYRRERPPISALVWARPR